MKTDCKMIPNIEEIFENEEHTHTHWNKKEQSNEYIVNGTSIDCMND